MKGDTKSTAVFGDLGVGMQGREYIYGSIFSRTYGLRPFTEVAEFGKKKPVSILNDHRLTIRRKKL